MHAVEVATGDRDVARLGRTGRDDHGVVTGAQVAPRDVDADLDAGAKTRSLVLHLAQSRLEVALLHLEVGDAIAQQPADAVVALEDGDGVAGARQLLRGGETCGARAHDGDGLAGQAPRRLRLDPAVGERVVDRRDFDLLDRHRRLVDAEHARRLARRGAQAAGELREVVRRVQTLDRGAALAPPHQVVPLRNEVSERAALVAERDAAVHAAPGLTAEHGRVTRLVHLFPVHDAHGNRPARRELALGVLQKALGVSHRSPP